MHKPYRVSHLKGSKRFKKLEAATSFMDARQDACVELYVHGVYTPIYSKGLFSFGDEEWIDALHAEHEFYKAINFDSQPPIPPPGHDRHLDNFQQLAYGSLQ